VTDRPLHQRVLRRVRPVSRASAALLWTAALDSGAELRSIRARAEERDEVFARYLKVWARGALAIAGVEPHIIGKVPPHRGARLIISNHRTAYDIPLMQWLFGGSLVSRADLAEWPVIGKIAKKLRTIFVDHASPNSAMLAIKAIRAALVEGRSVTIFPEGTTYAGDEVRPFFAGAFAAARGLDVQVIPVGLAWPTGCEYVESDFRAHVQALAQRRTIDVVVNIGEPQRLAGPAKHEADRLQRVVQELVDRARAREFNPQAVNGE